MSYKRLFVLIVYIFLTLSFWFVLISGLNVLNQYLLTEFGFSYVFETTAVILLGVLGWLRFKV